MALNLFGNSVNYKYQRPWKQTVTGSGQLVTTHEMLWKSERLHGNFKGEPYFLQSKDRLKIKPRTGPQGSRVAKDTKCMPSQASMENSECDLSPGIGVPSAWAS